jgi:rhodanese-related sulfurtransferase
MKNLKFFLFSIILISLSSCAIAQEETKLDEYVLGFNYETRSNMRVNTATLIELLETKKAVLLDIRFDDEFNSWNFPFAMHIALPDLPKNLEKLDKKKLYITACPHNDRAIIAMVYLTNKGYKVKYLSDGLLSLADYLRGNNAYNFIQN